MPRTQRPIDELPPPRSWVVAPGSVRKITMGTFRRRTPITDLLKSARWMGDVTPWSSADPTAADVPSWVNGRARARTPRLGLLVAACSALSILSTVLFVVRA